MSSSQVKTINCTFVPSGCLVFECVRADPYVHSGMFTVCLTELSCMNLCGEPVHSSVLTGASHKKQLLVKS